VKEKKGRKLHDNKLVGGEGRPKGRLTQSEVDKLQIVMV
jgi:hypothetical protein